MLDVKSVPAVVSLWSVFFIRVSISTAASGNPEITTIDKSGPGTTSELGFGEGEKFEVGEDPFLNIEKKGHYEHDEVVLEKTGLNTKLAIESISMSSQNKLLSTVDKDGIGKAVSEGAFEDSSTSGDESTVGEPHTHRPRDVRSAKAMFILDDVKHDQHKSDVTSLRNSLFESDSSANHELKVPIPPISSYNLFHEISNKDEEDEKNIPEAVAGLLPPGYVKPHEQVKEENLEKTELNEDISKSGQEGFKNQNKYLPVSESIQHIPGNKNNDRLLDLTLFGKVTTTTVDPIAAILEDVVIVDHKKFLPKGYVIKPEEIVKDEVEVERKNINELLRKPVNNDVKYKPGKLYGKKLAAFSKELKEAELFYSNANNIEKQKKKEDVEINERSEVRGGKILSDEGLALSAENIFASILEGKEIEIDVAKIENEVKKNKFTTEKYGWREPEVDEPVTPAATTTTATTTTSTPRPTTPGLCGVFCNLAGTLFIKSGLEWSEELLYSFTTEYKEATKQIVKELSSIFDHVYFGSSFEFVSVEAYSRRGEMVLVDVYVQFSDIVFQVTTKDVKESFVERLVMHDNIAMMGKYEIDTTWTYFSVIDTSVPEASMTVTRDEIGIYLPEWSLLAIVFGVISFFTIGFLGVIVCVNRQRNNQLLKNHVLNPRTLQIFKSKRHFDTVEVDDATAYANDKRDMWTLQKDQQKKRSKSSKSSLAMRDSYADSGHGSGSGIYSFIPEHIRNSFGNRDRKLVEKFPSGRIKSKYSRNHNDSGTELLNGFNNTGLDNTGLNCSEEIIEKNTTTDTSYENDKDDYERRVAPDKTRRNVGGEMVVQGDQGIFFDDSDNSEDVVSYGHNEMLIN